MNSKALKISFSFISYFLSLGVIFAVNAMNDALIDQNTSLFPNQQNKTQTEEVTTAQAFNDTTSEAPTNMNNVSKEDVFGIGDQFGSKITPELRKKMLEGNRNSSGMFVFGQNLFMAPINLQIPQQNPEYVINIGDKISINIWGAMEFTQHLTVDSQGNIFIPKIGPIRVADLQNKELNSVISAAVKSVYKDNIFVYANLLTAQPVKVYVSGYVIRPGLYDGLSSNSILYFLTQAGGIILNQGSFRTVKILRNNKVVRNIDLYDFLLKGSIPYIQFQQHDTILVEPALDTVEVTGQVLRPASYEPTSEGFPLREMLKVSGAKPEATYVLVENYRGVQPTQEYIPLTEVNEHLVYGGEKVTLVSDQNMMKVRVLITGSIYGPRQMVVSNGTTLYDVMMNINMMPESNPSSAQLYRKSLSLQQKATIEAGLDLLEREVYTKGPLTPDGASIQQTFAKTISEFVKKARNAQPKGQVVITSSEQWKEIKMEDQDMVNIPTITSLIRIDGEVLYPLAVTTRADYTIRDYINEAGGITRLGDSSNIVVVAQNGSIKKCDLSWSSWSTPPKIIGGDQIMVLPVTTTQALTVASAISQMIYQVAIATRVVITP
ncbi:MAG TPA: sugar ABC transporter substrate-binding protein [Lentisphaeria bacterium]|nr:MAG: hypothetical protein A2X47_11935 [Lentisphaerae bacterium GWF2_38_69]HBM16688.1 sugar ABC transporter substrate-binding protein [Lentisphaeria bacterium]